MALATNYENPWCNHLSMNLHTCLQISLSSPRYSLVIARPRPAWHLSLSLSLTLSHSHPHSIPKLIGHLEAPVTRFLQTARRILSKCISKRITRCARTPQLHTQTSPALPLSLHENSAPSPAIPRHHSFVLLQNSTSLLLATHILPNSTHENSKKNRHHRNP